MKTETAKETRWGVTLAGMSLPGKADKSHGIRMHVGTVIRIPSLTFSKAVGWRNTTKSSWGTLDPVTPGVIPAIRYLLRRAYLFGSIGEPVNEATWCSLSAASIVQLPRICLSNPMTADGWRIYSRSITHGMLLDDPTSYSVTWVMPQEWNERSIPLRADESPGPLCSRTGIPRCLWRDEWRPLIKRTLSALSAARR